MNRFIEVKKTKKIIFLWTLNISILLVTKNVSAQVVINEVFPNPSGSRSEPNEFIELMNISEEHITLTGYRLADASGKEYTIEDMLIGPGELISFRREITKIALNNTGFEKIILFNILSEEIDSFVYEDTIEDRSWSRYPDGTGTFHAGTLPTEGGSNLPPPTPTPYPSPKPTSTPKTTKAKSPTSTPKPSINLENSTKITPTTINILGKDIEYQDQDNDDEEIRSASSGALNNNTIDLYTRLSDVSNEMAEEELITEGKGKFGSIFFIFGGLGFIGAAGYPIIRRYGLFNVIYKKKAN